MKLLVLYGHHTEETEFGQLVCDRYFDLHNPDPASLQARQLRRGISAFDQDKEPLVFEEISELISRLSPDILLDIHHTHSPGLKQSHAVRMDYLLAVTYHNEEIDPELREYIRKNCEKIVKIDQHPSQRVSEDVVQGRLNPLLGKSLLEVKKVSNENGTRYLSLEAFLAGDESTIFQDQTYLEALQLAVNFIHMLTQYHPNL